MREAGRVQRVSTASHEARYALCLRIRDKVCHRRQRCSTIVLSPRTLRNPEKRVAGHPTNVTYAPPPKAHVSADLLTSQRCPAIGVTPCHY